ncbi:hypothetical protein CD351_09045 [Erythrobacter sp. KY5]|uniref:hypothetical protein n=1 Tax=Erythrobacter sp. KY5 TaxID=2011159 RepID=UPI000DBF03ED|nr:hypothetical protein [Erythrobacter sp. KY5]AWW74570.1 hypothetical protein CD351_09045 [Erythrobacter sp. KY5]
MAINEDTGKIARAGMSAASGLIPFLGGFLAAAAAAWSEKEQEHANNMLRQWVQMLEDELREKGRTITEIIARLDMQDEETLKRVESDEFQSLLKKSFRNWSSIDSEKKREKIRNILSNAAATRLVSDDVVSLFIDWIALYSDFHFEVIGQIYQNEGVSRGQIWRNLGRPLVAENSADADLYRMLIRDLSTGGVVRQHRPTDYEGNFLKKPSRGRSRGSGGGTMKSAFDDEDPYELTELGKQFVHYAMNELAPRLEFEEVSESSEASA